MPDTEVPKISEVAQRTYHRLSEAVYRRWAPEKLSNVPKLMEKYKGQESEVYAKALELYVFSQPRKEWRPLVEAMYRRFNPSKLDALDQVLDKYVGHELGLFNALCNKYINPLTEEDPPLELYDWGARFQEEQLEVASEKGPTEPVASVAADAVAATCAKDSPPGVDVAVAERRFNSASPKLAPASKAAEVGVELELQPKPRAQAEEPLESSGPALRSASQEPWNSRATLAERTSDRAVRADHSPRRAESRRTPARKSTRGFSFRARSARGLLDRRPRSPAQTKCDREQRGRTSDDAERRFLRADARTNGRNDGRANGRPSSRATGQADGRAFGGRRVQLLARGRRRPVGSPRASDLSDERRALTSAHGTRPPSPGGCELRDRVRRDDRIRITPVEARSPRSPRKSPRPSLGSASPVSASYSLPEAEHGAKAPVRASGLRLSSSGEEPRRHALARSRERTPRGREQFPMARPKRGTRKPERSSESDFRERPDRRDTAASSGPPLPARRDRSREDRRHSDGLSSRVDPRQARWKVSSEDAAAEDRLLAMHGFVAAAPAVRTSEQAPQLIEAQLEYRGQLLTFTLSSKTTLQELAHMFESWAADMRIVHEDTVV